MTQDVVTRFRQSDARCFRGLHASRPFFAGLVCLLLILPLLAGCNGDEEEAAVEIPEWLTSDDDDLGLPSAPPLEKAVLELSLKPGERFPIKKIVDQQLTQQEADGSTTTSHSRLELTMVVTVEDVRDQQTRMGVRYERVQMSQKIGGQVVEFDSASPPLQIPVPLMPYRGMVGDGFSFWIGSNNQLAGVEGFRAFLDRCIASVPREHQQQVLLGIEAASGENGISDFLDHTIGLLPYDGEQAQGDSWERTRSISRPVPMFVRDTFTLKDLTDEAAIVDISGTIAPSTSVGAMSRNDLDVRVTVTGGSTNGSCEIFRESGLPRRSQVEQQIEMQVQTAAGDSFQQTKITSTIVEAYPVQGEPTILPAAAQAQQAPASAVFSDTALEDSFSGSSNSVRQAVQTGGPTLR